MLLDEKAKRMVNAKRKMLEAEIETLEDTILDAIHWDRPSDLRGPLSRIRQYAKDIANQCNLGELDS